MKTGNQILHPLFVADIPLPKEFTYPFYYTPHLLCVMAAEELRLFLATQRGWTTELQRGKMFGVLVVKSPNGEVGYLAAFSGNLAGSNRHSFFVPPVYDLLHPDGFFLLEEKEITAINRRIVELESDDNYRLLCGKLQDLKVEAKRQLTQAKERLREAKAERDASRLGCTDASLLVAMSRESQFQKAEMKRGERQWQERMKSLQREVDGCQATIDELKAERKHRSAVLQQKLFEQFSFLNALGESLNLCDLFAATTQRTPPAGAGECAAPRLLQCAYLNGYTPLAMAEFWWGDSPVGEVRRQGNFYPACRGKCAPILAHMLNGLLVEENPLTRKVTIDIDILFEDDHLLVVSKPHGMLSVPGKEVVASLYDEIARLYPLATGPLVVHRLDMATSGVLLVAKTKWAHQHVQAQFKNRTVKKRYIALLDGEVVDDEGVIELPLCANPLDRPRQMVSYEYGKSAVTHYRVLDRLDGKTRIAFFPLTGRTHQLRVHAAHSLGLHCPIVGDVLYGRSHHRLYLHAESITFVHPVTGDTIEIETKSPF